MSSRRGWEAVATGLVLVAALGIFAARWEAHPGGLSAEQADSLAIARTLASGGGPRFTPVSSATLGPPNLVWLGVQVFVERVGVSPEVWLPRAALVMALLALLVVGLRGGWVWKRLPRLEDALPVLGLTLVTAIVEAAALGSGSLSWMLTLAASAVVLGKFLGSGRSGTVGWLLGALCIVRPAAAWFVVAAAPAWWIAARLEGRPATRELVRFLLGGIAAGAVVAALRVVVFGAVPWEGLFPSDVGLEQTTEFLVRQAKWFWVAIAATLLAAVWRRFHLRGGGTLLAWIMMTVVLGGWTEQPRTLFLGCMPLLAMLVGEGLSAARDRAAAEEADAGLARLSWLAVGSLALLIVMAAHASFNLGAIMPLRQPVVPQPELAEELHRRGLQQPFVAWADGAEAAELFPTARIVVVRAPSHAVEDLLVSEGPPDVVDARIVLEPMPRLAAVVVPFPNGGRLLSEQSADEDPRCPDGRLSLLSLSAAQLIELLESDVEQGAPARALSRWRCALAALEPSHLPTPESRVALAGRLSAKADGLEGQGEIEAAVRVMSLAASVSGESIVLRARAERLRARWLSR